MRSGIRYITAIVLVSLFFTGAYTKAQQPLKAKTLVHDQGKLKEKTVEIDFLNEDFQITHPYFDSLHVYRLDSVSFAHNIPELEALHGTRIKLNFHTDQDTLRLSSHTPEYYAIFSAYHTIRAMNRYKEMFGELIRFTEKEKYRELELYLGDYINCNPAQYVLNPKKRVSPTLIYHEIGHRAFCQLDDTLDIGNVFTILHNGLMEYFTATIAGHPEIGGGMLPPPLVRDASKPVRYPEDKYYYEDFIKDLGEAYTDIEDCQKAVRKLYEINQRRASQCTTRILMTHQTGMLLTHPLWKIREHTGARTADPLVVEAMQNMDEVLKMRKTYLKDPLHAEQEQQPQWFDLLYALYSSDQNLYGGKHIPLIRRIFTNCGYRTDRVQQPSFNR
jgi:hypothetical protein